MLLIDLLHMYSRFMVGLDTFGLLEQLRASGHLKEAFGMAKEALTAEVLSALYAPSWSAEGSNRRKDEYKVVTKFRDLLEELEGE